MQENALKRKVGWVNISPNKLWQSFKNLRLHQHTREPY